MLGFLIKVLVVLGLPYHGTYSHLIRVNSNIGFSGTSQEINLGSACFNLAHPINDDISSVDPNGRCIRLYVNERCRGQYIETEEIITDLTTKDVNDAISSIKLCQTLSLSSRSRFGGNQNSLEEGILVEQPDDEDDNNNMMKFKYDG